MKKINEIIKGKKEEVKTTDFAVVSHLLKNCAKTISVKSSDVGDSNTTPYLVSDDGKVIAKFNKDFNAVGFYQEVGDNVKHLSHLTEKEVEGTVFTIEKYNEINLITDTVPQGDILIRTSYDEVLTLDNESVEDYLIYADIDLDDIEDIIYTGLSKGKTENYIVDVNLSEYIYEVDDNYRTFGNIEIEEDTTCKNCDCVDYCTLTGEEIYK